MDARAAYYCRRKGVIIHILRLFAIIGQPTVGLAHGQAAEPQQISGQLMSWPYFITNSDRYFGIARATL